MSDGDVASTGLPGPIGRYEIRSRLGGDAFSDVFLGFDPLIERPVVVKVFPIDGTVVETFSREMQSVGLLVHPGIVALFDAGLVPGSVFMANEYVEGGHLGDLAGGAIAPDLPLRVSLILQIVDALEHAGERNVAHLDLKPSSVRVTPDFMLKVGGFGVAPVVDALVTARGGARRQTRYTAPERLAGQPGDRRSDVFSLARIAIDLLAGPAADPSALPSDLAARGVSAAEWTRLFARALDPDPSARFGTAGIFSANLLLALNLGEADARLALETSRTMRGLPGADAPLVPGLSSGEGERATMLSERPTDRPSGGVRGPAASESETVLGPAPDGSRRG